MITEIKKQIEKLIKKAKVDFVADSKDTIQFKHGTIKGLFEIKKFIMNLERKEKKRIEKAFEVDRKKFKKDLDKQGKVLIKKIKVLNKSMKKIDKRISKIKKGADGRSNGKRRNSARPNRNRTTN